MQRGNIAVLVIIIGVTVAGYLLITNYSNLSRVISRDNRVKINPITPIVQNPSPTSISMEQWKDYTDTKYGYSIRYPQDWEAKDITNEEVVLLTGPNGPVKSTTLMDFLEDKSHEEYKSIVTLVAPDDIRPIVPKKGPGDMWISGIRIEVKLSNLNKEVEKYKNIFNSGSGIEGQITTETINDTDITVISIYNSITGKTLKDYIALIEKSGLLYEINTDGSNHSDLFNQILSTFKFIP